MIKSREYGPISDANKVYIIIVNFYNWWDTIECLESVLRSDFFNYQIIVVDNNSPNNSLEHLKAWADGKMDIYIPPHRPLKCLTYPPVKKPIPYLCYTKEEAEKGGNSLLESRFSPR